MMPERLAEIRGLVDSYEKTDAKESMHLPTGYGVVRLDLIRELLAEIEALTRERNEWKAASEENLRCIGKVETRLETENARLAADVAKLREALMKCSAWIAVKGWELPNSCSPRTKMCDMAEHVLAETAPKEGT